MQFTRDSIQPTTTYNTVASTHSPQAGPGNLTTGFTGQTVEASPLQQQPAVVADTTNQSAAPVQQMSQPAQVQAPAMTKIAAIVARKVAEFAEENRIQAGVLPETTNVLDYFDQGLLAKLTGAARHGQPLADVFVDKVLGTLSSIASDTDNSDELANSALQLIFQAAQQLKEPDQASSAMGKLVEFAKPNGHHRRSNQKVLARDDLLKPGARAAIQQLATVKPAQLINAVFDNSWRVEPTIKNSGDLAGLIETAFGSGKEQNELTSSLITYVRNMSKTSFYSDLQHVQGSLETLSAIERGAQQSGVQVNPLLLSTINTGRELLNKKLKVLTTVSQQQPAASVTVPPQQPLPTTIQDTSLAL